MLGRADEVFGMRALEEDTASTLLISLDLHGVLQPGFNCLERDLVLDVL